MPLQATSGAASYDAFGGGVPVVPNYIEEVFQTWLYTGTGSAQTITNGIDFSTKGGLLWLKARDDTRNNWLYDTTRSIANGLRSDSTAAATSTPDALTAFNSNGFSIGTSGNINTSGNTLVSWSFRKQPKFFDVVTYTGTGSARTVAHNLGSVPGCILVKCTSTTSNWRVYHRSLANTNYLQLNLTTAQLTNSAVWNSTTPTATEFTVGTDSATNDSGATYVAYLFAHDAGGFGLTGTDNVISCGSYTGNGSADGPTVSLGYEPQWILYKNASAAVSDGFTCNWRMHDNMRGWATGGNEARLFPNLSNAEDLQDNMSLTATGFKVTTATASINGNGETFIYIAIRRGPMKVPTSGTSVFSPNAYTGAGAGTNYTTNFPVDSTWVGKRNDTASHEVWDRLRGSTPYLFTDSTAAEGTAFGTTPQWLVDSNIKVTWNAADSFSNTSSDTFVTWNFRRAPSFFDEVCYTGLRAINNTTPQVVSHNLGVAPELVIFKCRSAATISSTATNWATSTILGGVYSNAGYLNTNDSFGFSSNLSPADGGGVSASSITIGYGAAETNATGNTYVAYLFATCAGVSKVGSYTGTATTKQIDCGFTGGARFVLIKRTDSTGDWYVWDTARGIVSGNDSYLLLNSTAAEVTNTDYIDTYSAGFELSSTAPAALNASGGTYIFLAIA